MKIASDIKLIELLPVDDLTAAKQSALFEAISPVNRRESGFLVNAVAKGSCKVIQVQFNHEPAFILWYHLTDDCGLWIDACQSYGTAAPVDVAFAAARKMGQGLKYIRFMTIRQGLIKTAMRCGFAVDGLVLVNQS